MRSRGLSLLLGAIAMFGLVRPAAAQGDSCGGAPVVGVGLYTGTTVGATPGGADTCNGGDAAPDVWYAFTAPSSGALFVSLCGSGYDTVVSVHAGCPATTQNMVACNDDSCGLQSQVVVQAVGGVTYRIRVAGFLGDVGPYNLNIGFIATGHGDGCAQGASIGEGVYTGSTAGASPDGLDNCSAPGSPDVWYSYTAPASGVLNVHTCGSAFDTVLSIHSGCPGTAANTLACNDDNSLCGFQSNVSLLVTAGQTYKIRVSGFQGASGNYTLTVRMWPTRADQCAAAPTIIERTYSGNTGGATLDGTSQCGQDGPDVWYAYIPPMDGTLVLSTCGSGLDTILSVHTGCPGNTSNMLACNDDAPAGSCPQPLASSLRVRVAGGVRYFIRVAGYGGQTGSYLLDVGFVPGGSDGCRTATPISAGVYNSWTTTATADGASLCDGPVSPDVWFSYTAQQSGRLDLSLCGSNYDTVLSVHSGCPPFGQQLACNDDSPGCGFQSALSIPVHAGMTYLIRVGGFGQAGVYLLTVGFTQCAADWNQDGAVNSSDISAFITTWLTSLQAGTLAADFNGDGAVNSSDISAFITAWLQAVQGGGC